MSQSTPNPPEFTLRSATPDPLTQSDAIMAYEFFYGRNPESAFVIEELRLKGVSKMLTTCMTCAEFEDKVVTPLQRGLPVRRGDHRRRPSAEQEAWLASYVQFTEDEEKALKEAKNWTEYFRALCMIGGIDVSAEALESAATTGQDGEPDEPARVGSSPQGPNGEIERILLRLDEVRDLLGEIESSVRRWSEKSHPTTTHPHADRPKRRPASRGKRGASRPDHPDSP